MPPEPKRPTSLPRSGVAHAVIRGPNLRKIYRPEREVPSTGTGRGAAGLGRPVSGEAETDGKAIASLRKDVAPPGADAGADAVLSVAAAAAAAVARAASAAAAVASAVALSAAALSA